MAEESTAWAALADKEHGRLLRCKIVGGGHTHVDIVDETQFKWEGHQHHRPSPLKGKSQNTHASFNHEQEEELHRFVKQFTQWLEDQVQRHNIESLTIFAPPAFVGEFRQVAPKRLAQHVNVEQTELMQLDRDKLQDHPAIHELLQRPAGRR